MFLFGTCGKEKHIIFGLPPRYVLYRVGVVFQCKADKKKNFMFMKRTYPSLNFLENFPLSWV